LKDLFVRGKDNHKKCIPAIGLKIKTDEEILVFSSNTGNNVELWKHLDGKEFLKKCTPLYRVDMYEDIAGEYFPKLDCDDHDTVYFKRKDGKVEILTFTKEGSRGKVVGNHRGRIVKKGKAKQSFNLKREVIY